MELTVKTITTALDEAYGILKECCPTFKRPTYDGINIGKSTRNWATVHKKYGRFSLTVSKIFETMNDEEKFWTRLVGCMIHETIHTQDGCFDHGYGFKRYAAQVNAKYPKYDIGRCNSMAEWGADRTKMGHSSWVIACNKCGKEYVYMRKPKYIDSFLHGKGRCPICNGYGFKLVSCPTAYNGIYYPTVPTVSIVNRNLRE